MKLPSDVNYVEKTEFLDTLKGHYASIARKQKNTMAYSQQINSLQKM